MNRKHSFRRRQKPPFSERAKEQCRKFTAFMFSNVGIIFLVILYTIAGAFIFSAIEISEARNNKQLNLFHKINTTMMALELWNDLAFYTTNEKIYKLRASEKLYNFTVAIVNNELIGGNIEEQWQFPGAFLYSLTVITTIGYGNIAPKSNWGKIITIIYAIIGMPLFLLYLSNIGDILAKSFKWIYAKICLCRICPTVARKRAIRERRKIHQRDLNETTDDSSMSDKIRNRNSYDSYDIENCVQLESIDDNDAYIEAEVDAEIRGDTATITVPLTVCMFIMIGYVLFGAILFREWEEWPILKGSYFCFISLTSIGFGDVVPGDSLIKGERGKVQASFILCAVYLLLGMALIAMCFNLMQEQVIHEMRSIKRLINVCCRCNSYILGSSLLTRKTRDHFVY